MENDGRKDCSGSVERIICDTPGDREIKKQDERQLWGNKIILCGSYTVEAAVVCPMIFLVIVLIWYLGAFWHNQIRLSGCLSGSCLCRNEGKVGRKG